MQLDARQEQSYEGDLFGTTTLFRTVRMMSAVYVHIKYRCHLIRPPAMLLASTLGFCNPL